MDELRRNGRSFQAARWRVSTLMLQRSTSHRWLNLSSFLVVRVISRDLVPSFVEPEVNRLVELCRYSVHASSVDVAIRLINLM